MAMFQKSENVRWQVDGLCELLVMLSMAVVVVKRCLCLICSSDVMYCPRVVAEMSSDYCKSLEKESQEVFVFLLSLFSQKSTRVTRDRDLLYSHMSPSRINYLCYKTTSRWL